ncbi:19061_t:CDS:2 [Gigaspora rosea]|nr:19061_t:CDS:2 [Gigaspora rosea]
MEEYELEHEAIGDFLNNNLKALREYNSQFKKCIHHDCKLTIALNAQKSIRTLYIKRLDERYNGLPFLKKNEQTNYILSSVKELGSCDPILFGKSKIGTQKYKNINEDGIIYKLFGNCSVIVLCDGHGFSSEYHRGNSNQVVDLVLDSLIDISAQEATRDFEKKLVSLENRPTKNELKSVLSSTFRILNDMDTLRVLGTAMTCILVFRNNDIYVAYRGDSLVFVGFGDAVVKKITQDYNVFNKNETNELKREIREPRLIERLGFLAQHCLEPDLKGSITATHFFGNTIPKRIRGFKLFGDIVEEDPENYRQIEEYTMMTELVTINNQNMNISFMILCSNGDYSTIAFMLFTNQHGSFDEVYYSFRRTEFSITPDTEITNHVSNLD